MTDEKPSTRFRRLRPVPSLLRSGSEGASADSDPVCSFCGKPLRQVACLVENGPAKICAACIRSYAADEGDPPAAD